GLDRQSSEHKSNDNEHFFIETSSPLHPLSSIVLATESFLQKGIAGKFAIVLWDSMHKLIHPISLRLLFLPWIVTWVLVAPLFHLHTLDAQEIHSGSPITLPHTVFTPDLPGEYAVPFPGDQTEPQKHQGALATHFLHYSEEALGLFTKAPSRQHTLGLVSHSYPLPPTDVLLTGRRYVIPEVLIPPLRLQQSSVSLRAPPSMSS